MKAALLKGNALSGVILAVLILCSLLTVFAAPTPEGPSTLDILNSSRRTSQPSQIIGAVAGNVTQLNIFANTQTQTWQGYYGNVSGEITLDDGAGNTIYNWDLANPSGQVYASTSEIDFSLGNVECYNFSKTGEGYLDLTSYESLLGLSSTSADGINETFSMTTEYDSFYAGINYIDRECPTAYLYNVSNESSSSTYQELLLYDKTANDIIFTSLIKSGGIVGFNGLTWDFQMIVAENGRNGDTSSTPYYFYVALE